MSTAQSPNASGASPTANTLLRVIITGTTGMVGEGVLHECLRHPAVEAVLILNRKPLGLTHPKLREIVHPDFYNLAPVESQLTGYNACFFCLGVSSVGMPAEEYYKVTYTLTMHVAQTLSRLNPLPAPTGPPAASPSGNPANRANPANPAASAQAATPGNMIFAYVSGAGTDSTEKGRSRWARVKGKTENDLMQLPFRRVYAFRPGFIKPIKGLSNAHAFYKYVNWLFPLGRALYPGGFATLSEVGLAMIHLALHCDGDAIVSGKDIIRYAAAEAAALTASNSSPTH
ncbi:MAG TPA: epimerase [Puia sp.]|nr:epimerase [Puia sp.]